METVQREMTLQEWVDRLPDCHRAHKELNALRAQAQAAEQAEAALEEMRKQWDGFESWLQDEIEASKSVPFDRGVKARRILAELQRRRSPIGQEKE